MEVTWKGLKRRKLFMPSNGEGENGEHPEVSHTMGV